MPRHTNFQTARFPKNPLLLVVLFFFSVATIDIPILTDFYGVYGDGNLPSEIKNSALLTLRLGNFLLTIYCATSINFFTYRIIVIPTSMIIVKPSSLIVHITTLFYGRFCNCLYTFCQRTSFFLEKRSYYEGKNK